MPCTPRERHRVSTAQTVSSPRAAPRGRSIRMLRLAAADLVASPRGVRPLERHAFARIAALWTAARAVNLALLWGFFEIARGEGWGFGPDDRPVRRFADFLTGWDADRYGQIALTGYPDRLPVNEFGDIMPNNWAFLPVFPMLTRWVHELTGAPWQLVAVGLSLAASLGATWMLFVLLRRVTDPSAAWWAVTFFSFAPLSFVFAIGYSESLALLLTFAALVLAVDRRYLAIAPLGVVAAFTRPGALALAFALGVVFVVRMLRRRVDPFPPAQAAGLVVAGLATAAAGLAWSPIAERATGVDNAYIRTELGWWLGSVGNDPFVPFTPWFRQAGTHLGVAGIALVLVLMALFAALVWSRPVRRLGLVVAAYAAGYGLYLFAVFLPQSSTFRLLLPLSPLLGDARLAATPRRRRLILGACLVLQVVAVWLLWTINHP